MDAKSNKNIILLTIDCLRADHLHCMGYHKKITPTMDHLAKNGTLFTTAIANAPHTPFSVPSFLTSIPPPLNEHPKETLAGILQKNGYATAGFNPNPIIFSAMLGFDNALKKGFDTYDLMLSNKKRYSMEAGFFRQMVMRYFRSKIHETSWIHHHTYAMYDKTIRTLPTLFCPKQHLNIPLADELVTTATQWIKNQQKKFFLWIHFMDVHEPYAPPHYENQHEMLYLITKYRDFPNMLTKEEIQKLIELYDLEIQYTDQAIQMLIQELQTMGKYENTVIIISADHGDAFGEHGTLGHGGKFRVQLYDEYVHVPFIIHGSEHKGQIHEQVQLLDLAPTICDIAQISTPPYFFGQSMFHPNENGMIIKSRYLLAYRTNKYKLIIHKLNHEENELYDLTKDPQEKNNIYMHDKTATKQIEEKMIKLLEQYNQKKKLLNIQITI